MDTLTKFKLQVHKNILRSPCNHLHLAMFLCSLPLCVRCNDAIRVANIKMSKWFPTLPFGTVKGAKRGFKTALCCDLTLQKQHHSGTDTTLALNKKKKHCCRCQGNLGSLIHMQPMIGAEDTGHLSCCVNVGV